MNIVLFFVNYRFFCLFEVIMDYVSLRKIFGPLENIKFRSRIIFCLVTFVLSSRILTLMAACVMPRIINALYFRLFNWR